MRSRAAILIVATLAVGGANAETIYVNNVTGDDRAVGAYEDSVGERGPVRSIRRALQLARVGDHVLLTATGQPYREEVSLSGPRLHGTRTNPFILDGRGATLEGMISTAGVRWRPERQEIFSFAPRYKAHQQLFFDAQPAVRRDVSSPAELADLGDREWTLVNGRIYFRVEPNRLPQDYQLEYADLPTGVTLYQCRHVRIQNLKIRGFQLDGINATDGVRDTRLINIESLDCGRSGVAVGGTSEVDLVRSKLAGNAVAELIVAGESLVRINDCQINAAEDGIDRQGGQVLVDGQPLPD